MYIPPIENHFAGFVQLTEADPSESIYVEKKTVGYVSVASWQ
jgi:alpha-D-ribose 1-methylphosphonate 5-triphosphate synthase subunit PhnL